MCMNENKHPVVVSGVDIPFADLVSVLIKLALAAIPAAFILSCIGFLFGTVFAMVFGTLMHK